jgi:hypothetical protein
LQTTQTCGVETQEYFDKQMVNTIKYLRDCHPSWK